MSLLTIIRRDFRRSFESIKLPAIEETFDIYFSRFFGYYFALLSRKFGLTPNQVSIFSLLMGLVSGVLFYFQDNFGLILCACFFITLSGVLDSADGQLARMTGQSSDLGRKIDAIIDTLVFLACYIGGALYFLHTDYGWWIAPLAAFSGYLHGVKSGVYEYYKTEFVYYVKGARDQRIPFPEEFKERSIAPDLWSKILYYLELDYIRKQTQFHSRTRENRSLFESHAFGVNRAAFCELYTKVNEPIMTWWALICGTNTHRTALMVCSLFGRMDIYFFFSIVTFIPMFSLVKWQGSNDRSLLKDLN